MKILISNNKVIGVYTQAIETATEYQCDNVILPKSVIGAVTIIDGEASVGDIWDGIIFTKPIVVPVVEVPQSVTPRQARLALLQATLLDEVELLLANDKAMKIWWEYSLDIERNHEYIVMMGMALGLTATQLDDLFVLATTL